MEGQRRRWCSEAGEDAAGRGGAGEPNLAENGELAAFCREIKAQGPTKKISRGFHASVIHSENGSLLKTGKKKKKTDIFECLPKRGTSQIF